MSDFWASLVAWYKERTTSSLYGTYVISFVIWNWQIFYTYFFQAKSVIQIPTVEYVQTKLLFFSGSHIWYQQMLNDFWIIIPPMIFTYLIVKVVPIVNNWVFEINTKNFYDRKSIEDKAALNYEEFKNERLQKLVEIKQEQNTNKIEIQKNTTEEEKWEVEYELFKKNSLATGFKEILNAIYNKDGLVEDRFGKNVNTEVLTYAHINELISFDENSRNRINLTKKGKFFAKNYLETK